MEGPGVRGQGSALSVWGRTENSPRPSLYAGPASHGTRDLNLVGLQLTPGEQHNTHTENGRPGDTRGRMSVQYATLNSLCDDKICDLLELMVALEVVEILVLGVVVVVVMVVVVVVMVIVCLGTGRICKLMFHFNTMWALDDRMRV